MANINVHQIKRVAECAKKFDVYKKLDFITPAIFFPPVWHTHAVNFFFFWVLQNHGFWYGDEKGYVHPMYGIVDGKLLKGSSLMTVALYKTFLSYDDGKLDLNPQFLSNISCGSFIKLFYDDNGPIVFPDFEVRFALTHSFGKYFCALNAVPQKIIDVANSSIDPLLMFLSIMNHVPGFKDPLLKKSTLLAMALSQRPEKFLHVDKSQDKYWKPIVDYHLMRVALRLGLVDLKSYESFDNKNRLWVSESREGSIRSETFLAVKYFTEVSGLSAAEIDYILWTARKYCPEMEEPKCNECVFGSVCAKRTKLFQPVFRTTNY